MPYTVVGSILLLGMKCSTVATQPPVAYHLSPSVVPPPSSFPNETYQCQGLKFPSMTRGGAAVSAAPLSSGGMPFSSSGGGGDLFAVGFSGGSIALYDGRCSEEDGMVGGFVAQHRWLERLRSSGSLLLASYGRCVKEREAESGLAVKDGEGGRKGGGREVGRGCVREREGKTGKSWVVLLLGCVFFSLFF